MSGALFIINIPTETEEKYLKEKSKKIRFDIPSKKSSKNNLSLPSSPLHYGTFHQTTPNVEINSKNVSPSKCENKFELPPLSSSSISLDISSDSSMEIVLKNILKKLKIEHSTWTKSNNDKYYQIIFSIEHDEKYETLLRKFNEWGIGDREGSTVSILHCATFNTFKNDIENENNIEENKEIQKNKTWNRFMNSFTARLNVAQIVKDVKQEAAITFDFIILLISAAILASFGLVGDSTIFLASSMLISPLMGPIIATIFGTAIKDRSLQSLGIFNELFGIVLATLVGYSFGIIMCAIDEKYETGDGFTFEILSRCELNSLLIGFLTAIPSGAAAAIAVLGGNTGSLVGVAISASILPPAVNSGIVWAFSTVCLIYQSDEKRFNFPVKTQLYSDDQAFELLIRGAISMCITLSNVICIYVMGILVLKIKEIAPVISHNNNKFWKHDIKIARDFNKNSTDNDQFLNEITTIKDGSKLQYPFNICNTSYQNTWSPMGNRHNLESYENRSNLKELEKLYFTVVRPSIGFPLADTPSQSSVHKIGQNELKTPQHRTSIPFEASQNCKLFRNRVGANNLKRQPLEKIWEGRHTGNFENCTPLSVIPDNTKKLPRKFIITPASIDNK